MYTFSANTVIESAKVNANFNELQDNLDNTPPVGSVLPYAGSTAPTGYLIADGTEVSRSTYAELFAVIGTTYGAGNGTTTFTLPNLKGKVPVGKNASETEFDALGETGGAKTHTLTTAEMPSHSHTDSGHQHGINEYRNINFTGAGLDTFGYFGGYTRNTQTGYASLQNTGGGGAHNNLQPYITLNYIIRH